MMTDEELLMMVAKATMQMDHGCSPVDEGDDVMARQSLADLRATAAIVREVIFNNRFARGRDFIGADFGSGSSILMLASMIAALRSEAKKIFVVGFDISKKAIEGAKRCLDGIIPDSFWRINQADILNPDLVGIFRGMSLNHWVSETFSDNTPAMKVEGDGLAVFDGGDPRDLGKSLVLNQHADPFPQVLINTVQGRPGFFEDVRGGKTAMFPDIVNGQYIPDFSRSLLSLRTGTELYRPLHEVGREFSEFEDFGMVSRWPGGEMTLEELQAISGVLDVVRGVVGKTMKKDGGK